MVESSPSRCTIDSPMKSSNGPIQPDDLLSFPLREALNTSTLSSSVIG